MVIIHKASSPVHLYSFQGIIEGDQIDVADFYLESFAYLTGLVTANHNAGSNSARSHIANRIEAVIFESIGMLWRYYCQR